MPDSQPHIALIGGELAIRFSDLTEAYFKGPFLRARSPSAERVGERDLLGSVHGGEREKDYSQVQIVNWQWVGAYAIRIFFSDGHASGIYSFVLLKQWAEKGD